MLRRLVAAAVILFLPVSAFADWKDDLETAVRAKYQITKTGLDRLRVTQPGTVFVLKQSGVRADLATDVTLYANKITAGEEGIAQASGIAVSLLSKKTSRALEPGEEMYLYAIDVSDKEVKFQLLTLKTYQVVAKGSTKEMRFKALLVFQFDPSTLPSMTGEDVFKATNPVFAPKSEVTAPKTLRLGLTRADVEAIAGQPDRILDLGQKITYVYKDLRVTFVDDRVTDLQ